jgi:hypothetical protein
MMSQYCIGSGARKTRSSESESDEDSAHPRKVILAGSARFSSYKTKRSALSVVHFSPSIHPDINLLESFGSEKERIKFFR